MPSDGNTPSAGWKEVYASMDASTNHEAEPCPDCGDETVRLDTGRRWCPTHGMVAAG